MNFARDGEVITFYSYKGGTGRSMALANVAGLLAQEGKRVLIFDWDLEAPGLHRYFADRMIGGNAPDSQGLPGVVDLMWRLCDRFGVTPGMTVEQAKENCQPVEQFDEIADAVNFHSLSLPIDCGADATGQLHLIKAGSFNDTYSRRVNTIPWEPLFYRAPGLFEALARYVSARCDYVLIDSRTGLTDISGICTMLMPQKLVVVFTPNRQSLDGVLDLSRQALGYRTTASDMRPLMIFPLASRIDNSETDLRVKWRHETGTGYQPRFEDLLKASYGLDSCNLQPYFDAAQIPHSARFSYGERIAVLEERVGDTLSLAPFYAKFKERLVSDANPWEDPAAVESKAAPWEFMDRFMQQLPEHEYAIARDLLTRLVRPAGKQEGSDALLVVPIGDLPAVYGSMISRLERAKIVTVTATDGNPETIQLAGENIPRDWRLLHDWIDADRPFLLWRDSLRKPIDDYRHNRNSLSAVDQSVVAAASGWLAARGADLTAIEIEFVLAAVEDYRGRSARLLCSLAASDLHRTATGESAVRSALLAAESLSRFPTVEGDQAIRDALVMIPPRLAKLENTAPIGFLGTRSDRVFVACASGNQVRFWLNPEGQAEPLTFQFERPIIALASSKDANIIAACDAEGAIFVIRDFGAPVPMANVPSGQTYLEFDYEDRLLASPSAGGLFLIDVESGLMTLVMPVSGVVTLHRSSIDRKLFCIAAEGANECWVWHAGNQGAIQRIPTERPCSTAAFSSDNRQIAVAMPRQVNQTIISAEPSTGNDVVVRVMPGDENETILTVFDLDPLSPVVTHRLTDALNRLMFTPGDLGIVAVTGGRTAQSLPVRVKTSAWRSRIDSDVYAAAANASAGLLALGGADGTVRLIDFSSGRETMRADHGAPVRIARFNSDGEHLITAGEDGAVCVWDVRGLREAMRLEHTDVVWDVQFHPSGAQIVSVGNDVVQAVEVPSGRVIGRRPQFGKSGTSAAFSPDGKKLAVTLNNGQVETLSWPQGEGLARHFHKRTASCCAFSPDGAFLASGGWDGRICLIPQNSQDAPTEFQHPDMVWDVRFDQQSKWLVSGDDRGVRIWNVATKTLERQILLPAACHACLYLPDGQSIAAACDDGICRILTAGGARAPADGPAIPNGSRINSLAISPDGEHLALGGDDAVKIWSLTAGRQIVQIRYEGEVQWVSFSPDGRYLAVASSDTTTRLWLWQPHDLIEEARRRARRALTPEEWAQAVPSEAYRPPEPESELALNPGETELLSLLNSETTTHVTVNERVYDDLNRLVAFGLIRGKDNLGFQRTALHQVIEPASFFELTPKAHVFLRRAPLAAP